MAPRFSLRSFYQQSAANDNPGHGSRLVLTVPVRLETRTVVFVDAERATPESRLPRKPAAPFTRYH
tara:strand:+ start:773 stop:970 length:198 start_codon:yes stop_codon:yes gene_type:complete